MPLTIAIRRSRNARLFLGGLYLLSAGLLCLSNHAAGLLLPMQLLLAAASLYVLYRVAGNGPVPVQLLVSGDGWWLQRPGQRPQALTAVRPLLVRPWLLGMRLYMEADRLDLWLPADAVSPEEHWQLRRLALGGIATPRRQADPPA